MADKRDADQIKTEILAAMPDELGKLFHALHVEIMWLHFTWYDYQQLFASGEDTLQLLTDTAPRFFRSVQRDKFESTLLHLCRLTDKPETKTKLGTHEHLTIKRLPATIPDAQLRARVNKLVHTAVAAVDGPLRELRHSALAHKSLPPIGRQPEPPQALKPITRQQMDGALLAVRELMNAIQSHYMNQTTLYERPEASHNIDALLAYLRKGREAFEREHAEAMGRKHKQ